MNFNKCLLFFEILSALIMIISYILIIIQSFDNYYFKYYKTKEKVIERLLFEQFADEVNSNIKSYAYSKNSNEEYTSNKDDMVIELKTDSYYDCLGIKDDELNENCQNKKVQNYTCCRADCCIRTLGNKLLCNDYSFDYKIQINNKILLYNDDEINEDPRRRLCVYSNKYKTNTKLNNIFSGNIDALYRFKFNYNDIYLKKSGSMHIQSSSYNKKEYEYDCGSIDTLGNHLYVYDSDMCPINYISYNNNHLEFSSLSNNNAIIIRSILSELPPNIHEWKDNFINPKTKEKMSNINQKSINEIINNNDYTSIYQNQNNFIISAKDLENYFNEKEKINKNQKLNLYTTNYIGFRNSSELKKFNKLYWNEVLYKFGENIYPSLESIIIGFILIALCLIYIVLFLIVYLYNIEKLQKIFPLLFYIKQILILLTFCEELGMYIRITSEFPKISIDMDKNYKNILDLYNKRRFQFLFLLSIIFLASSIIITIIGLFFYKKNEVDIDSNERQSINNNNIDNNKDINIENNESKDILRLKQNRQNNSNSILFPSNINNNIGKDENSSKRGLNTK